MERLRAYRLLQLLQAMFVEYAYNWDPKRVKGKGQAMPEPELSSSYMEESLPTIIISGKATSSTLSTQASSSKMTILRRRPRGQTGLKNPAKSDPPEDWARYYHVHPNTMPPGIVCDSSNHISLRSVRGRLLIHNQAPKLPQGTIALEQNCFLLLSAELFATPGLCPEITVSIFPDDTRNATLEDVARFYASQGITVLMGEDTAVFALTWIIAFRPSNSLTVSEALMIQGRVESALSMGNVPAGLNDNMWAPEGLVSRPSHPIPGVGFFPTPLITDDGGLSYDSPPNAIMSSSNSAGASGSSSSNTASAQSEVLPTAPMEGINGHVSSEATATAAADDPAQGQGSLPKRKKGALGSEEKKLARAAAIAKLTRITKAVRTFVEQTEELVKGVADAEGISEECMHQLAGQVSAIKNKKAPSNWNILAHFKGQELNEGCPAGAKLQLGEIQNAIYEDEDMMDILHSNNKHMQELHQQYNDEKDEEQKAVMHISTRTGAILSGKLIAAFQAESSSMKEQAHSASGSPVGVATPPWFNQDSLAVATLMASCGNISVRYDQDIQAVQSMMIEGWPTDVPFAPPSKVKIAFQVKTLYDAWKSGEAHWRTMSAAEKRTVWDEVAEQEPVALSDNEDEDEDKDDEAEYCPKKKGHAKKGGNDEDCLKVEKGKAPRKRKAPTGNDDMEGPRKKKHQSVKSSAKSVEKGVYVFGPAGVANKAAKKVAKKV
ncbi:hypothetical protein BT96DRAFT_1003895 [Gymnopus androsaceus JB14]|uniref:Uncharacterized protein n=1 Tax=Gymnopus androsaceus JB14 TaxID=1447944 RepID=A0A6A4GTW7_9AGAR|nr:hypothetical protein BT96DRAFT_1003895 [Gymnopus androsaceus JB14]